MYRLLLLKTGEYWYYWFQKRRSIQMKLILKILAAPVVIVLTPLTWLGFRLLKISAWVFGLAGVLIAIPAAAFMLLVSVKDGLILLAATFLICPYGIPMLTVYILGGLQNLTLSLRSFIRG